MNIINSLFFSSFGFVYIRSNKFYPLQLVDFSLKSLNFPLRHFFSRNLSAEGIKSFVGEQLPLSGFCRLHPHGLVLHVSLLFACLVNWSLDLGV